MSLMTGLFILLLGALGGVIHRLRVQGALLSRLRSDQAALTAAWRAQPPAGETLRGAQPLLIGIEILNPIELACTQSPFAGPLSTVAPDMIRRIVYQRAASILREELASRGAQATITVHGVA